MTVDQLGDGVGRVLAPNPSFMTGNGTNSYLVGTTALAVIDPGPEDPAHFDALEEAAGGRARCVLLTHHHMDHAAGAASLAERLGVPLLAYGMPGKVEPDRRIGDGDEIELGSTTIRAVHTPGHASDHLCFVLDEGDPAGVGVPLLFSGDTVMGASSVVIAPPDGDMGAYLASLERLMEHGETLAIAPGHGELIEDGQSELDAYLERRRAREAAVAAALQQHGTASAAELVPVVYEGLDPVLVRVASFSLWAHLRHLGAQGLARSEDPDDIGAAWQAR